MKMLILVKQCLGSESTYLCRIQIWTLFMICGILDPDLKSQIFYDPVMSWYLDPDPISLDPDPLDIKQFYFGPELEVNKKGIIGKLLDMQMFILEKKCFGSGSTYFFRIRSFILNFSGHIFCFGSGSLFFRIRIKLMWPGPNPQSYTDEDLDFFRIRSILTLDPDFPDVQLFILESGVSDSESPTSEYSVLDLDLLFSGFGSINCRLMQLQFFSMRCGFFF